MRTINNQLAAPDPFAQAERIWQALGVDRNNGYQTVPAQVIITQYYPQVEISLPLLITQLTTTEYLTLVERAISNAYPPNHRLMLVQHAQDGALSTQAVELQQLGKQAVDVGGAALYLPPLPTNQSFTALQAVVAHLRSPEGCPWDRKQTLLSMRQDLLGECAEVLEAIGAAADGLDSDAHIAEELGDLLMVVALMLQITTEAGRFRLGDAMQSIVTKLIRRHPHVFAATVVDGVQDVLTNWDAIKAQEKADKGLPPAHPLDGVPAVLPALEKASQLQHKARKAQLLQPASRNEIMAQIQQILQSSLTEASLGELLWQVVSLARANDLNPEDALRQYSTHFRATVGRASAEAVRAG